MPVDAELPPQQPIRSVWTRPQRRKREQPSLSREHIVAVALELLDAEGLEALSMRKLGTRLNAGATSLYTHVANKDELLELAVDAVYGEIEPPTPAGRDQWRAAAVSSAQSLRSTFLKHPWMASVVGELGVTQLGPNMARLSEGMLALFETAGLPAGEADFAVSTFAGYVLGMTTSEAAWLTTLARSGQSEQDWVAGLLPAAEEALRDHPQLRAQYAAVRDKDPREVRDEKFDYGLQRVLDGLETRISKP
ncbi:TetR/AcrR family transcriptional regulator [Kitasatospora kifunensis]|uniref:AcrR family transcriptional regulator n=1 Tax=Kitasatospora kifunensis TaxID=58351 RepID=A0A7W7R3E0_KITKI|nr:TetR/AcrR family transcriptional regulator [Kitasatospora kifunensis]MBB4924712.1 AcrR family transcriptional regulator [Kitasatospora kifunensis]